MTSQNITIDDIVSICKDIYKILGKGHSENIYHNALMLELRIKNIMFSYEVNIPVNYKNIYVGCIRADIILTDLKIIIELKAVATSINSDNENQLRCYINNYDTKDYKGLLVNFNSKKDIEFIKI